MESKAGTFGLSKEFPFGRYLLVGLWADHRRVKTTILLESGVPVRNCSLHSALAVPFRSNCKDLLNPEITYNS